MLKIGSLLGAAIAAAMTSGTAHAPALAQQALQGTGPCPLGEELIPDADKRPPTLDTDWSPVNGTPVKPGDQIKVTMVARDEPDPRPTGIKTIQLVADSEGGRFIASENYEACSEPQERRVEATYTVPANPPPVVRLTALAEDHAGLMDTDVGEFPRGEHGDTADREDPTGDGGDWSGTFNWNHNCEGGMTDKTRGISDLELNRDGQGNLLGSLVGSIPERVQIISSCSSFTYLAPGTFSAKLVGSYAPDPESFSVQAVDGQTTPGRASYTCSAASSVVELPFFTVYEGPMFQESFRDLRRQPDGDLKSNGEKTITYDGGSCTTTYSLTLKQAQN